MAVFREGRPSSVTPTGNEPWMRPKTKRQSAKVKPQGPNINQWAEQQAQRYIDAQIASIEAERQAYLEELQRQAQMRADAGARLAEAMRSMGFDQRIQGLYQTAAHDVAGLAQGFAGQTRDIASADAAQQARMLSGTGQEGAIRNEGVAMGDVAYGVGGFIPGKSLGETGAHFAADAALQPGFALRQAQDEAARIHEEGLGGLTEFSKAIAEVKSGRPGLVEDFRNQRQELQQQAWENRFEMLKWQADQHYKNYLLALERGDRRLAMKEYNLAVRKQKQAEVEANRQYGLDQRKVAVDESRANTYAQNAAESAKSGGKVTTAQARDSMKDVVESGEQIRKDVVKAIQAGQWSPSAGKSKQRRALVNRLFNQYKYLALTAAAKGRLKKIIMQAVNEAGKIGPPAPGSPSGTGSGWDQYLES